MSGNAAESSVIKRADAFARTARYAAFAIFALALVRLSAELVNYFLRFQAAESAYWPDGAQTLSAIVWKVLDSGVVAGFLVLGIGVLAAAAARVASSAKSPSWAVPFDDGFARKALSFALIAEITAWTFLALHVLGAAMTLFYRIADSWRTLLSEASYDLMQITWQAQNVTNSVIRAVTTFFTFFLGAMIIRTLVIISSKTDVSEAVATPAAGDDTNA